jgi:hypothetical protein
VRARHWVPSHQTKAHLLVQIELGAHASSHAVVRATKGPECHQQSTCQTARIAISHDYAEKGQVPESTIGVGVRAWGFGRCMHACTRAIWRKKFGPDANISLTWGQQTWSHVGVVISRNRAETNPEMRPIPAQHGGKGLRSGSDRARPHMLCTARACSPLAMPLGSACGRARTMERWSFGLPATNLYEQEGP